MARGPERRGLELAGVEVGGLSIGGLETCILLPRAKLAFDIGRCPDAALNAHTVLFTHAHMDHMGGVAWHAATRALRRMPPPTYVVPRENAEAFAELFAAWRKLDRSDLAHELVPLGPGEELELAPDLVARPFLSSHRVFCQGYGLWRRTKHLLPEHTGKDGGEIARLKRAGVPIEEERWIPELAFTGDTKIEVVAREEVVRKARVLVMEVTFLDDRVSVEECRAKGHVHIDEVAAHADLFENEALLLTHFSARYTQDEIVSLLDERLPPALRERVTPLLAGHRR
jgi:ribonuclease Z